MAPSVPLLRALWSPLDGIWGVLKGSWGVLGKRGSFRGISGFLLGRQNARLRVDMIMWPRSLFLCLGRPV